MGKRYDITLYLGKETFEFYERQAQELEIPMRTLLASSLQLGTVLTESLKEAILKGSENGNEKTTKL